MRSSKWTARIKVERTERRVSRGYASVGLGEQGNRYGSKYRRFYSHEDLYVEECHYLENRSDLRIKDEFHSYMKEDSKSLAQAGMLTEI